MASAGPLLPSAALRYNEGSTLAAHVDVLKTHVLSAVYAVDVRNLARPWPMELTPDFLGEDVPMGCRVCRVLPLGGCVY